MNVNPGSDLARLTMLQTRASNTRIALDRAAVELTTGEKSSRFKATGGNLTRLFALERALERNAVFSETITLTALRVDVTQQTLGQILGSTETLSVDILNAVGKGQLSEAVMHGRTARSAFSDTIGKLNAQVAGQSLFAGTATDRAALAGADAILASLDAIAAAAPDAASAIAAIEDYFAAGSGSAPNFHGDGYVGATDDLSAVETGEGQRLAHAIRADNDDLVAVLQAQAIAAVVGGGAFAGNGPDQLALLAEAGSQMLAAKEGVLALRARVGASQYAVEQAKAERVSERDTLDLARAKIIAADPLEAASAYQQMQVQLESVYTVTSRLAHLSFVNFVR